MDNSRFMCMKKFIKEAKEFSTSNVSSNALVELLENIAALDFTTFSGNKTDVSIFFSSLWEVMSNPNAPHWSGVSVLCSAVKDSDCQYDLTHTYRFVPILTDLLLKTQITRDNKIKLLNLMEDLTFGIKINWQEPFLLGLMETLCHWLLNNNEDAATPTASILSVVVNLCYGNVTVINLVTENVDTRNLIKNLISRKCNGGESIQVCRLLLTLQSVQGTPPAARDIHNYLGVAMKTLPNSIREMNKRELHYVSILLQDLCSYKFSKSHVLTYDHFEVSLQEAMKFIPILCAFSDENCKQCLLIIFTILDTLIQLELYSLRSCHKSVVDLCIKASGLPDLMSSSYHLLGIIILQYEEDGMLPDDLASLLSVGLQGLLDPVRLDFKSAGVEWMRFVCALNDCDAMSESILHNVKVEKFEEVAKQILQTGCSKHIKQEIVLIACYICLSHSKRNNDWDSCFHHILSNSTAQNILSHCISNVPGVGRRHFLEILRHSDFPMSKINEVFFQKENSIEHNSSGDSLNNGDCQQPIPTSDTLNPVFIRFQEQKVEAVLKLVEETFQRNEVQSLPVSHLIELYRYKIHNMEHRLNVSQTSLQSANQATTQLNHSIAMFEATNKTQEELLFRLQIHNEKLEENVGRLSEQMGDAEKTIRKFQTKLAAEKLDREQQVANANHEYTQKIKELEGQIEKSKENILHLHTQLTELDAVKNNMEEKLNRESNKNAELADVFAKFENRAKQKEKKLEEAMQNEINLKNKLEHSEQTIKTLEKTLLERDKRLTQTTSQLEEMHRIQDIIANLMGNKGSANVSNNSTN
ncbi:uncharacterized protein LOC143913326 [Arctopsyche grandis]|uniref:uncharacterized protein LOC143913326 n=1 Tax=Arctopsyche grandis TaxID=121162 RepID=UPI00406D834C